MSVGRATNRHVLPTHMISWQASDSEPSQHVIASRLFHKGNVVKRSSHRLLLDLLCGRVSAKSLNSACSVSIISLPPIG